MTLLLAALLGLPSDPFARFKAFSAAHPNFQVSFSATFNGHAADTGTLLIQRPKRLLFRSKGGKSNYSISSTEAGYVEIERGDRVYEEFPSAGSLAVYPSEISPFYSTTLPRFAMFPDLRLLFPKTTEVTPSGTGDKLHSLAKDMMGQTELWADIDAEGKPTYFRRKVSSPKGVIDYEWHIKSFTFPQNLDLKDFITPLPLGFSPHALPRMEYPLQIGKPAPTKGWTAAKSNSPVDLLDLAGHKPFLFAILDKDSAPSLGALGFLKSLQDRLPVYWTGNGGYSDPSGKLLDELHAPATPMFYLIDGQGKVAKLWLGFDSSHRADFQAEVLKAGEEALSPKKP